MKAFRATIELLLVAKDSSTASGAISNMFYENDVRGNSRVLKDWRYSMSPVEISDRAIDTKEYFSETDGMGLFKFLGVSGATDEKPKSALELVTEVFKMMNAGIYQSSYEGQIIDKLRDVMALLQEETTFSVDMTVYRSDLLSLCDSNSSYHSAMVCDDDHKDGVSTKTMLARLLQYTLYDNDDGPQLRGDFNVNDKT